MFQNWIWQPVKDLIYSQQATQMVLPIAKPMNVAPYHIFDIDLQLTIERKLKICH